MTSIFIHVNVSLGTQPKKLPSQTPNKIRCGPEEIRTPDLPLAKRLLYQLSYRPNCQGFPQRRTVCHSTQKNKSAFSHPFRGFSNLRVK